MVPLELLTPELRAKYTPKNNERSKRAKKEDTKGSAHQVEENQVYFGSVTFFFFDHI